MEENFTLPAPKRSHHAAPKPPAPDSKTSFITSFFKSPPPPPQVGRPPGLPPKKRGPKPQAPAPSSPPLELPATSLPATSSQKSLGKRAAAALVGTKLKRINWGHGEPLERMTKVVADWDAKTGPHLMEKPTMLLTEYAKLVDINYQTLSVYCCNNHSKRKQLGSSVGNKPLFNEAEQQFVVDVVRRHDRGNDGLDKRQCIDVMQDMKPEFKRSALLHTFDRVIRPSHRGELTGIVKANPTTVKRTAITVAQQYRWHMCVDQGLAFLRKENTGLTPNGKTFGEVIDHFVMGGDETCFLASAADVKIIGDKEKPKHDLPTGSSRTSATIYRLGSTAGATGPTAFLPAGKQRKAGYTDAFLVKHGAPAGSTIVMTPTGYMTEEAWLLGWRW